MILGLFGGLIIILVYLVVALAASLAISFWFIAVPLFIVWFWWIFTREQRRQRNITPQQQARLDRDMAVLQSHNAMFKKEKAGGVAKRRRR